MLFWPLIMILKYDLFVESAQKWIIDSLWKEKAYRIAEV